MMYLQTIELYRGLFQSLGILTCLLVVLKPQFFILLDRDELYPVTLITLANQKHINPSDVHHRHHTGCCQRGFVSSDPQGLPSSYPKDCNLLEYESSMTPPLQRSPSLHDSRSSYYFPS